MKTTGVALPPDGRKSGEARTTHLIHFDGPAVTGRREINATWLATWQADDAGRPAMLKSLICQAWEDVAAAGAQP